MFTVDASVHINALKATEDGSPESQAFLERLHSRPWPVLSPTLLLIEIAAAATRALGDVEQGLALAQAVRNLPGQIWIPLDELLADEAMHLAAELRLRGADAVYAAVARCYGTKLITRDRQQLERLRPVLPVLTPDEALTHLAEGKFERERSE